MRIGIDVGGTNTDAVLIDGSRIIASTKSGTTEDVLSGVVAALDAVIDGPEVAEEIEAVMIGTTQFTNAVVERSRLVPTGVVRLGLPAGAGVPPMSDWPEDLAAALGHHVHMAHGGNEFDGRPISTLRFDELARIADQLGEAGVEAVAISSMFSPVSGEMELEAESFLRERLPSVRFSLSHRIGRLGLLERENATIINASLLVVAEQVTGAFTEALRRSGISAPVYLSQNDGTLMNVAYAREYPVSTFASGPTNSMRGAGLLSGLEDCIVIDIGGTTSDVGLLTGGFPRQAGNEIYMGGVRTNFRMPDVVSIGIGGGSLVVQSPEVRVGPDSVGYRLREEALVFGGTRLTATDIAVASGAAQVGDPALVAHLDRLLVAAAAERIATDIATAADMMRTSSTVVPAVLVGGGAVLVPGDLPGFPQIVRPEHASVANAVGAAIAKVGGEVDRIVSVGNRSREQVLEDARAEAVERAIAAGAIARTVEIVTIEEVPLSYLPGNSLRVRVKAVGDLEIGARS